MNDFIWGMIWDLWYDSRYFALLTFVLMGSYSLSAPHLNKLFPKTIISPDWNARPPFLIGSIMFLIAVVVICSNFEPISALQVLTVSSLIAPFVCFIYLKLVIPNFKSIPLIPGEKYILLLIPIILSICLTIVVNGAFDTQTEQCRKVLILNKYPTHERGEDTSDNLIIEFWKGYSLFKSIDVSVDLEIYDKAIPKKNALQFNYQPGFLGIPWNMTDIKLVNVADQPYRPWDKNFHECASADTGND